MANLDANRNPGQNLSLGFSLIEVLVALLVFAIGILGIISLQGVALMSGEFSGNMAAARVLGSDQLERISGLSFTGAAFTPACTNFCHKDIGAGVSGTTTTNIDGLGNASGVGRFRREWSVQVVDPPPGGSSKVKKITLRVQWSDAPGASTKLPPKSFNRQLLMSTVRIDPS